MDQSRIFGGGSEVMLIFKSSATKDTMEFEVIEGGTVFACCWDMFRPKGWEVFGVLMDGGNGRLLEWGFSIFEKLIK